MKVNDVSRNEQQNSFEDMGFIKFWIISTIFGFLFRCPWPLVT